jgi:protein-S-isoprenylcysteine O-methyltransferase Ste14
VLPPTYLLIALLAMVALGFLYPGVTVIQSPWNLAGIVPLVIGVGLNIAADKALHQAKTTVKPFEEPKALVTDGVYGISRHPMYLGFVLVLIGVALLLKEWTPYVVVPVFVILMEVLFIRFEEQAMQQKFGQAWLAYKSRVRRWI